MDTYTRMLDKRKKPSEDMIARTIGPEATARLAALEAALAKQYNLQRALNFPFGNNYGWGYKLSHGRKHLCYAFFEEGAFTVTLQIGDEGVPCVKALLPSLQAQTQALWDGRYPCGERGGWLHIRVLSDATLSDVLALIACKVKPPKKGGAQHGEA